MVETILIVDDDPEILRVQKFGLECKGYHVVTAGDAGTALLKLTESNRSIDMVITDYVMPGMTGMELLKKIKEKFCAIPVIIMTSYGEKALVLEAMKNGCDGFIEKSFSIEDLILEINRVKKNSDRPTDDIPAAQLSRMVHQINNPLMAISGNAQLGLDNIGNPPDLKHHFEQILNAVDAIKNLNTQIMRIGLSKKEPKTWFNIVDLIRESLGMFEGVLHQKKITVEKRFEHKEIQMHGFANSLNQAFKNLIHNAVDAMDGKPVKILTVALKTAAEKPGTVVAFQDTGCGISEKDLQKIFTPRFTLKPDGNGLGLTVVKQGIDRNGGGITVESRMGKGTCFTVELPLIAPLIRT